jgi:hypothetical protein
LVGRLERGLVKFEPFELGERTFDLSHLDSFVFEFVIPEKDGRPKRCYNINVEFRDHCFTKEYVEGTGYSSQYEYNSGSGDVRLFNEERYELSKRLYGVFNDMTNRKCYFTRTDGNFLLIERLSCGDKTFDYWILFRLSRAFEKNCLTLCVISAYPQRISLS